jgi:hypothetical protein
MVEHPAEATVAGMLDVRHLRGMLCGHLTPDNVRLPHRLCNRLDYTWRKKINALLGKRMSLEEIAEKLNAEKVPTIHGTSKWTAASVRKAFVS